MILIRDSFGACRELRGASPACDYFDIAATNLLGTDIGRLPIVLRVLLESLLRNEDGVAVTREDIEALAGWPDRRSSEREVAFYPARVLMPDSSGVPLIADLSAMRDAMVALGGDPARINPVIPVDLVVDHSVVAEFSGTPEAFQKNIELEFAQNDERYRFLRWAQNAYRNLDIVPPGTGIVHQINIEHLAQPVRTAMHRGRLTAMPDTLVGMDSHTPMVNGIGVFGWGVGGIEAASAMLGEPISLVIPDVVGCRLVGRLREGVTSTDLALTVTQRLRAANVVGKFVEFFGPGLEGLRLADRATLSNMAPEYGATMGFFPIDGETIRYLSATGRSAEQVELVETYARAQGLWAGSGAPEYSGIVEIDLGQVETSLAGPKRPQDRVALPDVPAVARRSLALPEGDAGGLHAPGRAMRDGDIVIAAIASCTNTSNPSAMIRAGLLARNATRLGLARKPWVKASLSPGSRVAADYFAESGLQQDLDRLGFNLAGFGCMTCSGGSGSLAPEVSEEIARRGLKVAAVLSGNRNFEGRIHPSALANFLAAPPLVVAYALAGSVLIDLRHQPLGHAPDGAPVYLRDIWPSDAEVAEAIERFVRPELYRRRYAAVTQGGAEWQRLPAGNSPTFAWRQDSTYLKRPPFFDAEATAAAPPAAIQGARILALAGDSITTDHISPGGAISPKSAAGRYLVAQGVAPAEFNNYLARRANHEVMIRGTFGNPRFHNEMAPDNDGGWTRHWPSGDIVTIFEAATRYADARVPLVVVAGAEWGTGSSRDWAAKGPALLGVRAVIAENFERIHRSNLIGMGVLPLEFTDGQTRLTLGLDGSEVIDLDGAAGAPNETIRATIRRRDDSAQMIVLRSRISTLPEANWYAAGGILPYVLRKLVE
jgi:aconitate hydratase